MAITSTLCKYYKVTLRRSTIGLPAKTKRFVEVLGLDRLQKTVLVPVSPKSAGNILKIKELVKVENVAIPAHVSPHQILEEMKLARKPHKGYQVMGSALPKQW